MSRSSPSRRRRRLRRSAPAHRPFIDAAEPACRVIGINSQIATGGGTDSNVGIGFAIPINTAKAELPTLERGGMVEHAFLGVDAVTVERAIARALDLPSGQTGALIERIGRQSPASKAGLRVGDVIVSLDGRRITGSDALAGAVAGHRTGDAVTVGYLRKGKRHSARVTLGNRPAS